MGTRNKKECLECKKLKDQLAQERKFNNQVKAKLETISWHLAGIKPLRDNLSQARNKHKKPKAVVEKIKTIRRKNMALDFPDF